MIDRFYKSGVVIKRKTSTDDGGGSSNDTWATYKTIKGLIILASGTERRLNEKKSIIATHTLFCAPVDINATDCIEYNGNTFEVLLLDNPLNLGHHLEIDLQLIK